MKSFAVRTPQRECLVDISREVAQLTAHVNGDGLCTVFVSHTTAGVTINENADPDVARDLLAHLQKLVPRRADFHHAEGNSDAHIKASLLGSSVQVPIGSGRLALGTWQGIYLAEFDGPRERKIFVHTQAAT